MDYLDLETKEILSKAEVKARNTHISLPKEWNENIYSLLNIAPLHPGYKPARLKIGEELVYDGVIYNDERERWEQSWSVKNVWDNEEEKQQWCGDNKQFFIEDFRRERDKRLAETDWVVIKAQETGTEIPKAYAEYRQAVRDMRKHEDWPFIDYEDWPRRLT